MIERGKHICFAREFVPAGLLVEIIGQFDNHLFQGKMLDDIVEMTITHEVDRAHAANADGALDQIAILYDGAWSQGGDFAFAQVGSGDRFIF